MNQNQPQMSEPTFTLPPLCLCNEPANVFPSQKRHGEIFAACPRKGPHKCKFFASPAPYLLGNLQRDAPKIAKAITLELAVFPGTNTHAILGWCWGGESYRNATPIIQKYPNSRLVPALSPLRTRGSFFVPFEYYHQLIVDLRQAGIYTFSVPQFALEAMQATERMNAVWKSKDQAVFNDPNNLFGELLQFQKESVQFAISRGGRVLIADDMGLGKTLQALAVAYHYRQEWPVLIVCLPVLKFNWREEAKRWLHLEPTEIYVRKSNESRKPLEQVPAGVKVMIAPYTGLVPLKCKFNVVILDESHCIKNPGAKRTQEALNICSNANRVILLSGTPTLAKPIELLPQIIAVARNRPDFALPVDKWSLRSNYSFQARYCAGMNRIKYGYYTDGHTCLGELQLLLRTIMIRRKKMEVLHQLPPKMREVVYLEVDGKLSNDEALRDARRAQAAAVAAQGGGGPSLDSMGRNPACTKLYEETAVLKQKAVTEYVCEVLWGDNKGGDESESDTGSGMDSDMDQQQNQNQNQNFNNFNNNNNNNNNNFNNMSSNALEGGEDAKPKVRKVLFFAHHRVMIDALENAVRGSNPKKPTDLIKIDGSVPVDQREKLVKHFNTAPSCRAAVLSIHACGTGLNLVAANTVVFAELDWSPSQLVQCEDRVHRIGQRYTCDIKYLLAPGTMDDVMWPMLHQKLSVTEQLLTEGSVNDSQTHLVDPKEAAASRHVQRQMDQQAREVAHANNNNNRNNNAFASSSSTSTNSPGKKQQTTLDIFSAFQHRNNNNNNNQQNQNQNQNQQVVEIIENDNNNNNRNNQVEIVENDSDDDDDLDNKPLFNMFSSSSSSSSSKNNNNNKNQNNNNMNMNMNMNRNQQQKSASSSNINRTLFTPPAGNVTTVNNNNNNNNLILNNSTQNSMRSSSTLSTSSSSNNNQQQIGNRGSGGSPSSFSNNNNNNNRSPSIQQQQNKYSSQTQNNNIVNINSNNNVVNNSQQSTTGNNSRSPGAPSHSPSRHITNLGEWGEGPPPLAGTFGTQTQQQHRNINNNNNNNMNMNMNTNNVNSNFTQNTTTTASASSGNDASSATTVVLPSQNYSQVQQQQQHQQSQKNSNSTSQQQHTSTTKTTWSQMMSQKSNINNNNSNALTQNQNSNSTQFVNHSTQNNNNNNFTLAAAVLSPTNSNALSPSSNNNNTLSSQATTGATKTKTLFMTGKTVAEAQNIATVNIHVGGGNNNINNNNTNTNNNDNSSQLPLRRDREVVQ